LQPKVQKLSANADNLEHNNETNTKPDKTEIKSEKRQNYGQFGPYFLQSKVNKFLSTICLLIPRMEGAGVPKKRRRSRWSERSN